MTTRKMVQIICPECGAFVTAFPEEAKPTKMRNSCGEIEVFSKEDVMVVCNNCDKHVRMSIITAE